MDVVGEKSCTNVTSSSAEVFFSLKMRMTQKNFESFLHFMVISVELTILLMK